MGHDAGPSLAKRPCPEIAGLPATSSYELVIKGLASPELLMEVDVTAVIPES